MVEWERPGQSTGVHLHFTVTDSSGGGFVDPLTFYNVAKATEPETIINIADIDLMSITIIPTGYIYHSEKVAGFEKMREYIRGWEYSTTPPMNADGTKYIIYDDGKGHHTVGYGVDIFNGGFADEFRAAGYSTSIGGEVPIEFVDALEEEEMLRCLEQLQEITAGLNLKEYQLHALVSRAFNAGVGSLSSVKSPGAVGVRNGKNFVEAYQAYWTINDDLFGQSQANYNHPLYTTYMYKPNTSEGDFVKGLQTRRDKEWLLFQTGTYDNKY